MNSVLIVTPVHRTLNENTLRCLYELQVPGGWRADYFQPRYGYANDEDGRGRVNLTQKQNTARKVALDGQYSHLLFVEEDMIIPQDALIRLLECDADVAYGLYCFRRPPHLWSAFSVINEEDMVGLAIHTNPEIASKAIENKEIVHVDGVGFGCTLINRKVLKDLSFRIGWDEPHPGGEISHSDFYFAVDCIRAGYTQRCHTGVVCGHIIDSPRPSVLVPVKPGDGLEKTWYRFLPYGGFDDSDPLLQRYQEWCHTPSDIQGHLDTLADIAKGIVVELGTRYGASTTALLVGVGANGGHVHSIDTDPECATLFNHPQWSFHQQDSTCTDGISESIDVLLVDTLHTYEQVQAEFDVWQHQLAPGATVLFHDTEIDGVRQAIEEWSTTGNYSVEWHEHSHGLAIVRLP